MTHPSHRTLAVGVLLVIAAALVIAGAAGNLGDRLINGGVTDFILVRFFPSVFNVADVAITCGAVLLAARLFFEPTGEDVNDSPTRTPAET